jgi:hypothetical protein
MRHCLSHADIILLQQRTETAQMPGNLVTGAERGLCQIYQAVEMIVEDRTVLVDLDQTLAESARGGIKRVMASSATSVIGSERVLCLPFLSQSVVPEKVVAQEQMMVNEERRTGSEELHQLHGVRAAHKARKMDQDHQDVSSRSDHLSSGRLLQLSKIASGALR